MQPIPAVWKYKGEEHNVIVLQFVFDPTRGDVVAIGVMENVKQPIKMDIDVLELPIDVLFEED